MMLLYIFSNVQKSSSKFLVRQKLVFTISLSSLGHGPSILRYDGFHPSFWTILSLEKRAKQALRGLHSPLAYLGVFFFSCFQNISLLWLYTCHFGDLGTILAWMSHTQGNLPVISVLRVKSMSHYSNSSTTPFSLWKMFIIQTIVNKGLEGWLGS